MGGDRRPVRTDDVERGRKSLVSVLLVDVEVAPHRVVAREGRAGAWVQRAEVVLLGERPQASSPAGKKVTRLTTVELRGYLARSRR